MNNGIFQIRVDQQDLCFNWVSNGCYKIPTKVISYDELKDDLKANGLEIISSEGCDFGGCYFFTVKGQYSGNIKINKI